MSNREYTRRKIASYVFKEAWKYLKRTTIYSISLALKLAWRTIRSKVRIYKSKVRGVSYKPRQRILKRLLNYSNEDIKLFFSREYSNMYDSNAISIMVKVNNKGIAKIGFVSKELAEILAPRLDAGYIAVVMFDKITGGRPGQKYLGCNFSYVLI